MNEIEFYQYINFLTRISSHIALRDWDDFMNRCDGLIYVMKNSPDKVERIESKHLRRMKDMAGAFQQIKRLHAHNKSLSESMKYPRKADETIKEV